MFAITDNEPRTVQKQPKRVKRRFFKLRLHCTSLLLEAIWSVSALMLECSQEAAQSGTLPSQPEAGDVRISPLPQFFRIIVRRLSGSVTSRLRDVLGLSWCEDGAASSARGTMLADRGLLTPSPRSGATRAVWWFQSGLVEATLDTN